MEHSEDASVEAMQQEHLYRCEVVSGIRPSGSLTIGNYVGAVKSFVELQSLGLHPRIFVADLHILTDREARDAKSFNREIVLDYIGCGMEPERCDIYPQSEIQEEIFCMTCLLMRHVSLAELTKVPTLKEKLKESETPEAANALLAAYPVMMASDILLQRARRVPVGEDQTAHLELVRKIARRFNLRYGEILPLPTGEVSKPIRVLGLQGTGKMGKSFAQEAIFLSDPTDVVVRKVKAAKTALEGEMNAALQSNVLLARELSPDRGTTAEIDAVIAAHLGGAPVMGRFKAMLSELIVGFLKRFRERRFLFNDELLIDRILKDGLEKAHQTAQGTLAEVRYAIGMR